MAVTVNVDGLATIKAGTGVGGALETLGYTVNGAQVRLEGFFENVHGDELGGEAGPPIDVQYHGELAHIHLELSKWDPLIADKLAVRVKNASIGLPAQAGYLMKGNSKTIRLLIHTPTRPFNFPTCIVRGAVEINKGTRHSRLLMDIEAHVDYAGGTLFNSETA